MMLSLWSKTATLALIVAIAMLHSPTVVCMEVRGRLGFILGGNWAHAQSLRVQHSNRTNGTDSLFGGFVEHKDEPQRGDRDGPEPRNKDDDSKKGDGDGRPAPPAPSPMPDPRPQGDEATMACDPTLLPHSEGVTDPESLWRLQQRHALLTAEQAQTAAELAKLEDAMKAMSALRAPDGRSTPALLGSQPGTSRLLTEATDGRPNRSALRCAARLGLDRC
jgi:hypothetical protein